MGHDIRSALRNISRSLLTSTVAVISLAAGIGATTATLTLRNAVFYNPPPLYQDPSALSVPGIMMPDRPHRQPVPVELYKSWASVAGVYSAMAAAGSAHNSDVHTRDINTTIMVRPVTAGLFELLGVPPALGRTFSPTDPNLHSTSTAMLSYEAWQRLFGGKPDALGAVLWIEDQPHTVIGVMPRRFWFTHMDPTVWVSLDPTATRAAELLHVVVRRKPGFGPEALADAFRGAVDRYAASLPLNERALRLQIAGIAGTPASRDMAPLILWLFEACVLLTLLISCTNVAVLMIAQWTAREREIAIRAALGAGRRRILRSLLTESILLAALGGISGLCVAFALFRQFLRHGPPNTELLNLSMDFVVLVQAATLTVAAGILAGIGPALLKTRCLHGHPARLMRSDRAGQRWRHALVTVEVSVTMALLIMSSIMLDGYLRALSSDQGFNRERMVAALVEAPAEINALEICERLAALPGSSGAAAASAVPLAGRGAQERFAADAGGAEASTVEKVFITSNFFRVLGVPIRIGHGFSPHDDRAGGQPVVIINESLARRLSPGKSPVGTHVWSSGKAYQVVGVVADYLWMPLARPAPAVYLPLWQQTQAGKHMQFVIRAQANAAGLVQPVRAALRRHGSGRLVSAFTMQSAVDSIGSEIAMVVYPMAALMPIGIFLSAAGIYAVLAFAVARRSKEIAVRIAVGASRAKVVMLVGRASFRLLATGVTIGAMLMFGLSRLAQGSGGIFDVRSAVVFVVPIAVLVAVGALATWMPMRRATAIDPAELLRIQ